MAGTGVRMNLKGLHKQVDSLADKMKNTAPLLEAIGEVLVSGTLQRFQLEQDPDGKPWEKIRRKGKILSDTSRLQKSISSATTKDSVLVGTNVVYAASHQFGATIKPKKGNYLKFKTADGNFVSVRQVTIKKRSFLGFSAEDKEEVVATIKAFFASGRK